MQLKEQKAIVVGASRGLGRRIATALHDDGARVLAIARGRPDLEALAKDRRQIAVLALDATEEHAADAAFEAMRPDILVICGGAVPPLHPIHEQSWGEFSRNWDTDVRASFIFCRAALGAPLAPGSLVVLISSGAALSGSPLSGGYAAAKRMQMFMAAYCQRESDRLRLGVRFAAIVPFKMMPATGVGDAAIAGYSTHLGISQADFVAGMKDAQSQEDVAAAVVALAADPAALKGTAFVVSARGMEAA